LPAAGHLQYFVPDPPERQAYVEARHCQVFQQRGSEWTVIAIAIVSGRTGLGGIGDQRVGAGGLDLPQTGDHRAARDLAFPAHDADEGIVAAGIENDETQPLGAVRRRYQPLQWDGLVIGVAIARQFRIDRNEIICPADFKTVTGIVDDGDVGMVGKRFELADGALELEIADIELDVD
jgi:hypothetical protein